MSRPVFEPSLTRQDAAQAWASRQLFRRPAPTSEAAPLDSAYLFYDNFDTIAGDGQFVNLEDYSTSVSGTYIDAVETPNGHFTIWEEGIYLASLVTVWANSFAAGKAARIANAGGQLLQDTLYWENWVTEENTDLFVDQVTVQALFFVTNAVGTQPTLVASVAQQSGSPEDLASADFSIVRFGDYIVGSS